MNIKQAGLIKVPEELFKNTFKWIASCYTLEVSNHLENIIQTNKLRIQQIKFIKKNLTYLNYIISVINQPLSKTNINQLEINTTEENVMIPKFDFDQYDSNVGLSGIITNDIGLSFFITEIKNNIYQIHFLVDFKNDKRSINKEYSFDEVVNKLPSINKLLKHYYNLMKEELSYFETLDEKYIKELLVTIGYCNKISSDYSPGKLDKYTQNIFLPSDIGYQQIGNKYNILATFETEANHSGSYHALWTPVSKITNNGFLGEVTIKDTLEDVKQLNNIGAIQNKLKYIANLIRHELQHCMQKLMNHISNTKTFGIPTESIRDKNISPGGNPLIENHGYPLTPDDKFNRIDHSLRDVEFYTNLHDNIAKFKEVLLQLPYSAKNTLIKLWIGLIDIDEAFSIISKNINSENDKIHIDYYLSQVLMDNTFFMKLKQYQPEKYKQAVKEFYKQVN